MIEKLDRKDVQVSFDPQEISDGRYRNYLLAIRLFLRELDSLNLEQVDKVFKHWGIKEVGDDETNYPGTDIDFPSDLSRIQWFYNDKEECYAKYIQGINKCEENTKG